MAAKQNKDSKAKTLKEGQHEQNVASVAMKPSNRAEAMALAVNLIDAMQDDNAINNFADMVRQAQYDADEVAANLAAQNAASVKMKASEAASKRMAEAAQDAIKALFDGDDSLTEEFKSKASAIFETQLAARVALAKQDLREQLEKEQEEKFEAKYKELVEKVDEIMAFTAKQWREDNKVAIESTLRTEATQEFIGALKNLFVEHYIEIPDEKVDVVEALVAQVEEIKEELNKVTNEKIDLLKEKAVIRKEKAIIEASKGLSTEDASKLQTLCEDFEPSDENLDDKIKVVKEAHFKKKAAVKSNVLTETFIPNPEKDKRVLNPAMAAAVETLKSLKKVSE